MASRALAATALLLSLNILFLTLVSATNNCPPTPHPKPTPTPTPTPKPHPRHKQCPKDTLKLGICADVLGLVNVVVGKPPKTPCCALLNGLVDLEAAVCLCTALKANVLGLNLNLPVSLSLVLNYCGKNVPKAFQCA